MAVFHQPTSRQRVIALVIYGIALLAIQYFVVEAKLPPSTINGLWFYNGIASLLLGSRLVAAGIKVICLDLTNQYSSELSSFLDPDYEAKSLQELQAAGGRGQPHQNKEQGGTKLAFKACVRKQLAEFLDEDNGRYLRVINPVHFEVWQQTGVLADHSPNFAHVGARKISASRTCGCPGIWSYRTHTSHARPGVQ